MKAALLALLVVLSAREAVELPRPPEPKGACELIVTTRGAIVICR